MQTQTITSKVCKAVTADLLAEASADIEDSLAAAHEHDRIMLILKAKMHYLEGMADGAGSLPLRRAVEDMRRLLKQLPRPQ
jgi:hypothetical protein